jgi:hypothetical protein
MKSTFCVTLGWWHAYKVANERLYSRFLNTIWGPAFHAISPRSIIRAKPTLTQTLTLFTQARLAYPSFRNKLIDAIAHPTLCAERKIHLQNIQDVFEFFMPIVSSAIHIHQRTDVRKYVCGRTTITMLR